MEQYTINSNGVARLISSAIVLGEMMSRKALMPHADKVNKKELLSYLKTQGYDQKDLRYWEEKGLIRGHSKGERSATKYSMAEVHKVLLMATAEEHLQ